MLIAIALAALVVAAAYGVFYLIGGPCRTCTRPVIDCRCPEVDEPDEPDDVADFAATVRAGYVQRSEPVEPAETPGEGS